MELCEVFRDVGKCPVDPVDNFLPFGKSARDDDHIRIQQQGIIISGDRDGSAVFFKQRIRHRISFAKHFEKFHSRHGHGRHLFGHAGHDHRQNKGCLQSGDQIAALLRVRAGQLSEVHRTVAPAAPIGLSFQDQTSAHAGTKNDPYDVFLSLSGAFPPLADGRRITVILDRDRQVKTLLQFFLQIDAGQKIHGIGFIGHTVRLHAAVGRDSDPVGPFHAALRQFLKRCQILFQIFSGCRQLFLFQDLPFIAHPGKF